MEKTYLDIYSIASVIQVICQTGRVHADRMPSRMEIKKCLVIYTEQHKKITEIEKGEIEQ